MSGSNTGLASATIQATAIQRDVAARRNNNQPVSEAILCWEWEASDAYADDCYKRGFRASDPAESSRPRFQAQHPFRGSAGVGFDGDQLVGTLPGGLHGLGRGHPGLECAFAGEALEFSATAGKLPCSFDRHLGAAGCDLALERAPVAVALTVDVSEVAGLGAFAVNGVRGIRLGDLDL